MPPQMCIKLRVALFVLAGTLVAVQLRAMSPASCFAWELPCVQNFAKTVWDHLLFISLPLLLLSLVFFRPPLMCWLFFQWNKPSNDHLLRCDHTRPKLRSFCLVFGKRSSQLCSSESSIQLEAERTSSLSICSESHHFHVRHCIQHKFPLLYLTRGPCLFAQLLGHLCHSAVHVLL